MLKQSGNPTRYRLNNSAFKIDGYYRGSFEPAKNELLSHLRSEIECVENMGEQEFLERKRRGFHT